MNRILKEKATVPLFFAQTLIYSLRDVGYNHTTSALCEHVDNAIQAGATEIRVFVRQVGKREQYETDAAVYDNGCGMGPNHLKVATSASQTSHRVARPSRHRNAPCTSVATPADSDDNAFNGEIHWVKLDAGDDGTHAHLVDPEGLLKVGMMRQ